MAYNRELAKQICRELGIKWNQNAKCATIDGEPINSDNLTAEDVFVCTPEPDCDESD
jgi:hypothetical protein